MPRFFDVPAAGAERDKMLEHYRAILRTSWLGRYDPAVKRVVTEEDIQAATQEGSRWFAQFYSLDLALLAVHAKAGVLADQAFARRATSGALALHGERRGLPRLGAVGATLYAEARATPGALFVGSTTIPDPAAAYATDSAGLTYQVLYNVTTPANGIAGSDAASPLILVGVDTGERTNLPAASTLQWVGNQPLSAVKAFTTTLDGSGGTDLETENEWSQRIADDDAHPSESGNGAHVRRWARETSVAVEDGFVYSCAKYAGTDVVCITQKRGRQSETAPKGPLARVPSAGTLARVRARLVPPGSPVSPERGVRYVTAPQTTYVDMSIGLALPRGRGLGWRDTRPFPTWEGSAAVISGVTSQTLFELDSDAELPSATPKLMVWRRSISRWEELLVSSVVTAGAGLWDVTLSAAPTHTLAVGDYISPATRSPLLLAQAVERYFDSLGPGEVVDLEADTRAPRAARFPDPIERFPQRAGSPVITTIQNTLPGAVTTGELLATSSTLPTLPSDPTDGPRLLVCGKIAVYPSD
jgi:uncharacterized phage protein gp47/JayE